MTSKNNKPEIESEETQAPVESTSNAADSQPESATTAPADDKLEQQAKRGSKLATMAIIIAIILGGGAAGYSYQMTQTYQAQIDALQAKLDQVSSQTSQKLSALQSETEAKTTNVVNRTQVELGQQQKSIELTARFFRAERSPTK